VVQILETFGEKMKPYFVETLDSIEMAEKLNFDLAPVMIYGDDVTHIVTEEGIANLLLCRGQAEREQAIRGAAGFTDMGRKRDRKAVEALRQRCDSAGSSVVPKISASIPWPRAANCSRPTRSRIS
jgi:malonate decarboxylase alpha subunit